MADIVIAALGSHGDVAPLTGVGARLQQAGHRVTLTAYDRFASLVRSCGIGFRGVSEPRESSDEADVDVTGALFQFLAPQGMRSLGTALLTALQDTPTDILLLSPFSELAGHPLAEAKGIPSAGIRFQPYSATADFPPATLGGWSAGPTGNRLASRAGAELVDRFYGGVTAGFRRDFGLPKVSARRLREQRTKAGWTVLHGFSPHIVPRPAGWRPGLEICGYWWPQTDPQWRPDAALVDFLRAGPPPVYVGFGSTMTSAKQSEHISQLVRSALRRAGVRGIVQAGWAGIDAGDETTLTVTEVPHRWLFPHRNGGAAPLAVSSRGRCRTSLRRRDNRRRLTRRGPHCRRTRPGRSALLGSAAARSRAQRGYGATAHPDGRTPRSRHPHRGDRPGNQDPGAANLRLAHRRGRGGSRGLVCQPVVGLSPGLQILAGDRGSPRHPS
ncbi:glycosyltransferase [Mycobacteroides abscessus subsp. abscessus]|nr:glycosyltransferase [Mycobacteroides abscessus subsp. abscessus]SLE61233.1 glycosyltransferase [Mycobacteroides abscessus subsp. abscessus]